MARTVPIRKVGSACETWNPELAGTVAVAVRPANTGSARYFHSTCAFANGLQGPVQAGAQAQRNLPPRSTAGAHKHFSCEPWVGFGASHAILALYLKDATTYPSAIYRFASKNCGGALGAVG